MEKAGSMSVLVHLFILYLNIYWPSRESTQNSPKMKDEFTFSKLLQTHGLICGMFQDTDVFFVITVL